MSYELHHRKYAPIWNKYRPVILKMMLDAGAETQHYRLMSHEFQQLDLRKKKSFAFNLHVSGSRAMNNIRDSEAAQDLLNMLLSSPRGSELINSDEFEFVLDRDFMLHISKIHS